MKVSSKKWVNRGGLIYGYKFFRTTKFICRLSGKPDPPDIIPDNMRGSETTNHEMFRARPMMYSHVSR